MRSRKTVLKLICVCMAAMFAFGCLASCGKSDSPANADSEVAMENFVKKIEAGNYVLISGEYVTVTAASPEQVYVDYKEEGYEDFAYMTLNGETFKALLAADKAEEVEFISTETALEAASAMLPNAWVEAANGNMFDLFYNNPEAPLEFTSHDENVMMSLLKLMGYGEMAMSKMEDVHMVLDKEDPTSVHFTAVIEDDEVARIFYDDVDITVDFGTAKSDARIDQWLKDPVYPETRTAWTESDLFYLNSVFLQGYGENALPFPSFASYALRFDDEVFGNEMRILLSDPHATEADVESYKAELLANGFTKVGDTEYRKPLRPEYRCSVSADVTFDNGLVIQADNVYDNPTYGSLAEINEVIGKFGFEPLTDDPQFKEWKAVDTASERTESWLYFFNYDLSLYITLPYEDADALSTYLDSYCEKLNAKGFEPVYIGGGEEGEILDYYESPDHSTVFRYQDDTGDRIVLQFRHEKNLTPDEAKQRVKEAGFPEAPLTGNISCRDLMMYHKMTRGFDGVFLSISQPFASAQDAESFLDNYTATLETAGFDRENPEVLGSLKQNAYYDEARDMYFAFDYFPDDKNYLVSMDFVVN